jgi:hypothetical protein
MDMIERDLVPEYIDLADSAIEEARLLSQTIPDPLCAWQVYLAHLGLTGFDTWVESHLEDAGLSLKYDRSLARLLPSSVPDRPSVVTQLQLGAFRVCLLAVTESDEGLEIPAVAIEHPDQAGHFYGVVTVNTEAQVASFKGFLRHDQVQGQPVDGVYEVAIEQLECDGDRLFFLTMGLDGGAIVLPQGVRAMEPIRQMVMRPVMDAVAWGRRQVAQSLESLDTFLALADGSNQLASGFRGEAPVLESINPLQEIRSELTQQGYTIPVDVQAGYEDIAIEDIVVRLATAKWQIPSDATTEAPEWSLLVIAKPLGAVSEAVQLVIQYKESDINQMELRSEDSYRYTQAIGTLDELFTIAITYGQTELVLPPVMI